MGTPGFYVLGHFIAYYGLMIAFGIAVAAFLAYIKIRRYGLNGTDFIILCSVSLLFALLGAKLMYVIVSINTLDFSRLKDPAYLAAVMSGGFVFYGGVLGAIPAFWLCRHKFKIAIEKYIPHCFGCFPIAHGFGRVGCFLVGCCYGVPYDGPAAVTYSHSLFAPNGIPLFPVQLAEAGAEIIIGIMLYLFCGKMRASSVITLYIAMYTPLRFGLEFLRYDTERGGIFGISTSQLISIALFLAALLFILIQRRQIKSAR
jgi:phosphatidylglycerol:prolipoprotein diacylglycerol transferase